MNEWVISDTTLDYQFTDGFQLHFSLYVGDNLNKLYNNNVEDEIDEFAFYYIH